MKKCALYCSNALICDSDLNSLGRYVHRKMNYFNIERALLGLCCAQGCTIVFNSKLADVICSLDFALQKVTLHDLFLTRLIFMIDGFFYADNSSYLKYRMHEDNIGGLKTAKQISKVAMIKKRFKYMIEKKDISIIEQLVNIRDCYNKYINNRNSSIINNIIKCKSNFYYRLLFALKPSLRDESFNLSITNRIKIILGNF